MQAQSLRTLIEQSVTRDGYIGGSSIRMVNGADDRYGATRWCSCCYRSSGCRCLEEGSKIVFRNGIRADGQEGKSEENALYHTMFTISM